MLGFLKSYHYSKENLFSPSALFLGTLNRLRSAYFYLHMHLRHDLDILPGRYLWPYMRDNTINVKLKESGNL